jgi:hypothetical protein
VAQAYTEPLVVSSEDPSYSVLADPAVDANLTDAAIDSSSGDPLLSFRITGTEDTTHTVTSYQIQVGTGTSPGSRAAYGDSGDLAPGAPPTFAVSGIPLASDVYIRVITKFVQSPTLNHNIYICQFGLNGELAPTIAVVEKLINDPSGAMLITPASGDYAETIDAGVTDLLVAEALHAIEQREDQRPFDRDTAARAATAETDQCPRNGAGSARSAMGSTHTSDAAPDSPLTSCAALPSSTSAERVRFVEHTHARETRAGLTYARPMVPLGIASTSTTKRPAWALVGVTPRSAMRS